MRIGQSTDIHRLCEGRKLILGGVEIPYEKGLLGHSDADALTHAVAEAILGALALGDLGKWFPDTDPKWEGVNSQIILQEVGRMMEERGYRTVVLAGGVAANSHLRRRLESVAAKHGARLSVPPISLCGDNGAMVAAAGYFAYLVGQRAGTELNACAEDHPAWEIGL